MSGGGWTAQARGRFPAGVAGLLSTFFAPASFSAEPPVVRAARFHVVHETPLVIELEEADRAAARGARVLIADANGPIGWMRATKAEGAVAQFVAEGVAVSERGLDDPAERFGGLQPASVMEVPSAGNTRRTLRAWIVPPDYVRQTLSNWPAGAALVARVDSIGPGGASAWVTLGSDQGIAVGDRFWLRQNGQPLVRLDVRLVDRDIAYARLVRLAAGAQLFAEQTVTVWPEPGLRRSGRTASAVCFVEKPSQQGEPLVWIAAPPDAVIPDEPRVEFFRDGSYVGFGLIERRDERFWYVRLLTPACAEFPRVGDDATIRTLADVREKTFSARVFARTSEGFLITAGEPDGLAAGQTGLLLRGGVPVGCVEVTRAQGGYAACARIADRTKAEPSASPADAARTLAEQRTAAAQVHEPTAELVADPHIVKSAVPDTPVESAVAILDEVRFGASPALPEVVGIITQVAGELFTAEVLIADAPPTLRALAVRKDSRTIGTAILVAVENGRAIGFVIAESMMERLVVGSELAL